MHCNCLASNARSKNDDLLAFAYHLLEGKKSTKRQEHQKKKNKRMDCRRYDFFKRTDFYDPYQILKFHEGMEPGEELARIRLPA
jgi:hypothetical protein